MLRSGWALPLAGEGRCFSWPPSVGGDRDAALYMRDQFFDELPVFKRYQVSGGSIAIVPLRGSVEGPDAKRFLFVGYLLDASYFQKDHAFQMCSRCTADATRGSDCQVSAKTKRRIYGASWSEEESQFTARKARSA